MRLTSLPASSTCSAMERTHKTEHCNKETIANHRIENNTIKKDLHSDRTSNMTPTIALKCRLDRAMKLDAHHRHWNVAGEIRRNIKNADSGKSLLSTLSHRQETEDDAANLLLSMSKIVTNEIKNNSHAFDDEGDFCTGDASSSSFHATRQENLLLTPRERSQSPTECDAERFNWSRARTVSIDSPLHAGLLTPKASNDHHLENFGLALGRPALISPTSTPIGRGRPVRRASLKLAQKSKRDHLKVPKLPPMAPVTVDVKEYKKKALQNCVAKGAKIQTIGRKKFSWKNYPGMSFYLVASVLTCYHQYQ